ncbi:YegP family protein [Marilutibacter chinensis]|uniref:YegP family protein n=1 Tax=Marilutibacter chinensis TaxID=2912247 RepID=A0ABS9HSM8_9GAMM|nr:YegP family protein [Lysobacter chinensis]MCF7221077.1 YegP family protein [Lysobacter chinensis]
MAGKFELKKSANGQFHFNLKAGNGEIILSSEMYESKDSARNGIASVQKNCSDDARYEKKETSTGKHYFTLKAGNHQVIGNSQMYTSAASRDAGIESVKHNGTSTDIEDNS